MTAIHYIRSAMDSLYLGYFNFQLAQYHNFDTGLGLSYLATTGYVLLLIGALLYTISKGKEVRLIRFIFSIILLTNCVSLAGLFLRPIQVYYEPLAHMDFAWWLFLLLFILKDATLIYLTRHLLALIATTRTLETLQQQKDTTVITTLSSASNWKRFAHLCIDTFICVFIFSPYLFMFPDLLHNLENQIGEYFTLYVFLFVTRLIYYPLTEIILQASPAKLLTGSRIVTDEGTIPGKATIFKRTLLRFIPLEPFSFFELNTKGWHDRFSRTQVVNEIRTGVRGQWYLLILPAIPIAALATYFIHEKYERYETYLYNKKNYDQRIALIQNSLNHLTTSHVFQLRDVNNEYGPSTFLIVEEIKGDHIMAAVIADRDGYNTSLRSIERSYNHEKKLGILQKIPVRLTDLQHAYTIDYDDWNDHKRTTATLLNDKRKFEITRADQLFGPSIHERGTGSRGTAGISIDLVNEGWPAKAIAIETLQGPFKCIDILPVKIPGANDSGEAQFTINSDINTRGEQYKIKLVLQDSLDHRQTYIIEGRDLKVTVTRTDN